MVDLKLPATLGGDLAGIIESVGSEVSGFKPGDAVFGQAGALSGAGSFAEFAPAKYSAIAQKPEHVDFVTAAAYPLVSTSAYQAIVEHIKLLSGQKIIIHGGGGGIGSMAIQLAKHVGAYVATTVSTHDIDYVHELGADEVIDYTKQDFASIVHDYDAVFDTVGGESNTKSYQMLCAN